MKKIQPISVLLVDDQQATLWGLGQLIDGEWPHMAVAGKACDRETALRLAATESPDVILLDLDLAGESSLDFLPELLERSTAQVLVCTCLRDRWAHEQAMLNGACGVVMKDEAAESLLDAITTAHHRRSGHAPA